MKTLPKIFLILLFISLESQAQVIIQGSLSGFLRDTTYSVVSNIWVDSGDSLYIEAGAEFLIAENVDFDIFGYIFFEGTETDTIKFVSAEEDEHWDGINIHNSADDSGSLNFCLISGSESSGVYYNHSSVSLFNCIIDGNESENGGGGIYCESFSNPLIMRCYIQNNTSNDPGGGIKCQSNSNPEINGCFISFNCAFGHNGGGIYCGYSSSPYIFDSVISENSAGQNSSGGGIQASYASSPIIESCMIYNNYAGNSGGGGIGSYYSSPEIIDCDIYGNIVAIGGTYFCGGGGIRSYSYSNPTITGSNIFDNYSAGKGGGVFVTANSSLSIIDSHIYSNRAEEDGGGICIFDQLGISSNVIVKKCLIYNNSAAMGGGIGCPGVDTLGIINCTITGNSADISGGGVTINDGTNFYNNIVAFNYNGGIDFPYSMASEVWYSDIFGNTEGDITGRVPAGMGFLTISNFNGDSCDVYKNIFDNPMFIDTSSANFELCYDSPCIDAGNILSPPDPDHSIADIGACFYNQLLQSSPFTSDDNIPEATVLYPATPNPFNQSTVISFEIPDGGNVNLTIFDITGREVRELAEGFRYAGSHQVIFEAKDLSSGVYFAVLSGDSWQSEVQKLILLK